MSLLLWPFKAVWAVASAVVGLVGRLVAVLMGLALVIVGGLLTVTVIGAPIGIPLIAVGLMLIARGLF